MSGLTLPTARMKPTVLVPRSILLYGSHKIGKTAMLAQLEGLLHCDSEEGGSAMYEIMRVDINTWEQIEEVGAALYNAKMNLPAGQYPYRFIALDTIDRMEDSAVKYETAIWNHQHPDPKDQVASVYDLEYGRGYGLVRDRMTTWIQGFGGACEHLILICHVKDKVIGSKDGMETTSKDLALSGKLGAIICSKVDVIAYMYRHPVTEKLRMNFKTGEQNPTMGARFTYLTGKDFEFGWETIFSPSDEDIRKMQEAHSNRINIERKTLA